ncbi:MAG: DUF5667 domain-containing protein [Patescibacteria group bacterium]
MNKPTNHKKPTDFGVLFKHSLDDQLPQTKVKRLKNTVLVAFRQSQIDTSPHATEEKFIKNRSFFNKLILRPMIPVIIAIALIITGTGTAIAADQAKPGDALYPVDRAIERVTYNFAFSDTSKANMLVKFAAERENEQKNLTEAGRIADAQQASVDTKQALQNAAEVIARVQEENQESSQTRAGQALNTVEEKLLELQNRFTERQREEVKNRVKNAVGEVEIEATTKNGQTTVIIKFHSQEIRYTLNTTDNDAIIASVQERTGLGTDDIRALIRVTADDSSTADTETDDTPGSEETPANINTDTNTPNLTNQNNNLNYEHNYNSNYNNGVNNDFNYNFNGNTSSGSQNADQGSSANGQDDQDQNRNINESGD